MRYYSLVYAFSLFILGVAQGNAADNTIAKLNQECGIQLNGISNNEYPWVTFIPLLTRTYNPGANVRCVGALISERYVITSSTCLQFVVTRVHLGQYDTSRTEDGAIKIDVDSWSTNDYSDVALLKLAENVTFSENIRPICLPFNNFKRPENKTIFYTSGWGMTSKTETFSTTRKVMKNVLAHCKSGNQNSVCLRQSGTSPMCNGDEGSPIMYLDNDRWILYGILNSVFDKDGTPCAINNPAGGITFTNETLNWIVHKIES